MHRRFMYRFIKFMFLLPLITSVVGGLLLNQFNNLDLLSCPSHHMIHEKLLIFIGLILFINIVAAALSIISYYCLLYRVKKITEYREIHDNRKR